MIRTNNKIQKIGLYLGIIINIIFIYHYVINTLSFPSCKNCISVVLYQDLFLFFFLTLQLGCIILYNWNELNIEEKVITSLQTITVQLFIIFIIMINSSFIAIKITDIIIINNLNTELYHTYYIINLKYIGASLLVSIIIIKIIHIIYSLISSDSKVL
jgi:hypothetical protein